MSDLQETFRFHISVYLTEITSNHKGFDYVKTMPFQGVPETGHPVPVCGGIGQALDAGNPAVPFLYQVFCCHKSTPVIFAGNVRQVQSGEITIQKNHGKATFAKLFQVVADLPYRRNNQPVHIPALQQADRFHLVFRIFLRITENDEIAISSCLNFHKAGYAGEEGVGNVRNDQPNGIRSLQAQ